MVLGSAEVLLLLQRGYVDVGFMGGAQIDQYGNLNSSFIGDPANPKTRLPGTGGGNDISSLTKMIVAMKHEKRRFVENVDFVTSPGWLKGGHDARATAGCWPAACTASSPISPFSVSTRTTRRMKPLALNPGVTRDRSGQTGFKLVFSADTGVTEPPTEHELSASASARPGPALHRLNADGCHWRVPT